jgi:CRP-like cAMP-binding protein
MTTTDVLRAVPLFQGMSDRAIDEVGRIACEADFPAGAALVRQGEAGESFIVIVDGTAEVSRDGAPIRELARGDFLGEIALIDGGPRTATVTATTPVHALTVDREGFIQLLDDVAVLRYDVLSALTQRIRRDSPSATD